MGLGMLTDDEHLKSALESDNNFGDRVASMGLSREAYPAIETSGLDYNSSGLGNPN